MIMLSLYRGLIDVPDYDPEMPLSRFGSLRLPDHVRDEALAAAAAFFDVLPEEIYPGRGLTRSVAHARQMTCFLLRERRQHGRPWLRAYGFQVIGHVLGLDHTTVQWAVRAHAARCVGSRADLREWRAA